MEWTTLLQKAIDYMEAHMLEKINYEDVAGQVNMSGYNFHRTFSFMAGMTANEYIRNRRLSLAGQDLLATGQKVIDAAYKYGYDSPESFSKAFTRFHGVSPKMARIKGTQLRLFNPLVIKITLEGGLVMDYRMEEMKSQKFIALVREFSNEIINDEENHEIPDFWTECYGKKLVEPLRSLRPEGKKDLYGLCSPKKENETTFRYGIGIALDEDTGAFEESSLTAAGYQIWEAEPQTYVVFKCFGEDGSSISEMWGKFYKEFVPQMGYEAVDATDYEVYYENGEPGLFCELWIPVRRK
ncbi:AraC family transcriptional regulator [Eisenbergiella sp.]